MNHQAARLVERYSAHFKGRKNLTPTNAPNYSADRRKGYTHKSLSIVLIQLNDVVKKKLRHSKSRVLKKGAPFKLIVM